MRGQSGQTRTMVKTTPSESRPDPSHDDLLAIIFTLEREDSAVSKQEFCRDYINKRCIYGSQCPRIHINVQSSRWTSLSTDVQKRIINLASARHVAARYLAQTKVDSDIDYVVSLPRASSSTLSKSKTSRTSPPPLVEDSSDHTSDQDSNSSFAMEASWDPVSSATDWTDQEIDTANTSEELESLPVNFKEPDEVEQERSWDPGVTPGGSSSSQGAKAIPPPPRICWNWQRGRCQRQNCKFLHMPASMPYHAPTFAHPRYEHSLPPRMRVHPSNMSPNTASQEPLVLRGVQTATALPRGNPPPTRVKTEVCRRWLQGRCPYVDHVCKYLHEHQTQGANTPAPSPPLLPKKTMPEPSTWNMRIHDHLRVKMGSGFKIEELKTGFETPFLYLTDLPESAVESEIMELLKTFGVVVDLRMLSTLKAAKVQFASHAEALEACRALDGSTRFGPTAISARLPISTAGGGSEAPPATFDDRLVKLTWEPPSRTGYAGFADRTQASNAIAAARGSSIRGSRVFATMHSGVPALAQFTVKFRNLPLDVTKDDLKQFGAPVATSFGPRNYASLQHGISDLKRFLRMQLVSFDLDSTCRDGYIWAWLTFSSSADAARAVELLNGRRMRCFGDSEIRASHFKTMLYSLNESRYARSQQHISELVDAVKINPDYKGVFTVIPSSSPGEGVTIKLMATDVREVGRLKAELEMILHGEVLRLSGGRLVWDGFFSRIQGRMCVRDIERRVGHIHIRVEETRRRLILFGSPRTRKVAKAILLARIDELNSQQRRAIYVPGRMLADFLREELAQISRQLGPDNVAMDLWNSKLMIRGDMSAFEQAQTIVRNAQKRVRPDYVHHLSQCPVCFDIASAKVRLNCGHMYCRGCMTSYLTAARDNRLFPLTCIGDEGKCSELVPLHVGKQLLSETEFHSLAEAALNLYVERKPEEYRFCPTRDCSQIYSTASAAKGSVLQCPSCLVRICPRCNVEHHEAFECPERTDDGDHHLDKWVAEHDVKSCPGCKVLIERAEGCNHMTCSRCKTHICWVCMKTFPMGEGIYAHMMRDHGTFGLD